MMIFILISKYGFFFYKFILSFFRLTIKISLIHDSTGKAYLDCKVIVLAAKYDVKPYSFGFQKNSPYVGLFNFHLKKMRERGVIKETLKKITPPQVCPDLSGKPLGINSSFTAFLLLIGKYEFYALSLVHVNLITNNFFVFQE